MGSSVSLSSSSQFNAKSFIETFKRSGQKYNISNLTESELNDKVKEIRRIKIPFSEDKNLQKILHVVYVTGNSPFHEGLIIITNNNCFYSTQTYPIAFEKCLSYEQGIDNIASFCASNRYSKKREIRDIWIPQNDIIIKDIINIVKNLPNRYDLIKENCQFFCDSILKKLPLKKKGGK